MVERAEDPKLLEALTDPAYPAGRVERAVVIEVTAWDGNCPQHIPRKLSEAEVRALVAEKDARIAALEAEVARLTGRKAGPGGAV